MIIEVKEITPDNAVVGQSPKSLNTFPVGIVCSENIPDGYMTLEEFRHWGHDLVNRKFGKK
jgi:hypothetical protein